MAREISLNAGETFRLQALIAAATKAEEAAQHARNEAAAELNYVLESRDILEPGAGWQFKVVGDNVLLVEIEGKADDTVPPTA